jgi:Raf kinase inhibitor-like YbhB/YbcL family protein
MMRNYITVSAALLFALPTLSMADSLSLSSNDITQGEFMPIAQEYNGFGCAGGDLSPHLHWSGAPEGTKSFAVTVYDPDAPTGSGWWHWQIVNIPATVSELEMGAGSELNDVAPQGSIQIKNDFGQYGFGGACPPQGHGVHHYQFTVHALSVEQIALPEDASGALTGYMINANTIESATIEALYQRD